MDSVKLKSFVNTLWDDAVVPSLTEYIRIPNKSPAFDKDWAKHGYMDDAVKLMEAWARARLAAFKGATLEVVRLPGRTPVIFMEIPGEANDTVLLYGHLDKQPEIHRLVRRARPVDAGAARRQALRPRRRRRRLRDVRRARRVARARRSARAACALRRADRGLRGIRQLRSARTTSIISPSRIGKPSLVVCLDSGCGDYDRLWLTTSLRGIAIGTLTVKVLNEGVHSGDASGIVPSSFRIARMLLSRLEDETSGAVIPQGFHVDIPPARIAQAKAAAQDSWQGRLREIPLRRRHAPDDGRRGRADAQPHLAAAARGDRRRGLAGSGQRGQRAAALDLAEAVACACRRCSTATRRWR